MGYANIELIEKHALSVIYSDRADVWHVISPFNNSDPQAKRISSTNSVLRLAIAEVVIQIEDLE